MTSTPVQRSAVAAARSLGFRVDSPADLEVVVEYRCRSRWVWARIGPRDIEVRLGDAALGPTTSAGVLRPGDGAVFAYREVEPADLLASVVEWVDG